MDQIINIFTSGKNNLLIFGDVDKNVSSVMLFIDQDQEFLLEAKVDLFNYKEESD